MNFFGRDDLLHDLDALWGKSVASLVTCRGRRRIGKSTLIAKFAERSNARFIKLEGLRPCRSYNNEDELRTFSEQLASQTDADDSLPSNWLSAFKRLNSEISDDCRTVVLLDEVSWMAWYDKTFAGTLKIAWDNLFKRHDRLILVVCGSVSTWIRENLIDDATFFGRRSLDVVVPELPLEHCARFWDKARGRASSKDIVDILSVTGGVPRYLEEVNPLLTPDENIKQLCFRPNSTLRTDFDEMFSDVITRQPRFSADVLSCLVDGPRTVTEIAEMLAIGKGGHISDALSQLEEAGFVSPDAGKNPETGADIRELRFRLKDNYARFYLKYIQPAKSLIDAGAFDFSTLEQLHGWDSLLGLQFENLIVNHFPELLPNLHLKNTLVYSAAPYRKNGPKGAGLQIDLLLQTRRSHYVIEIKRQAEIGKDVIDQVAETIRRLKRPPGNSVRTALVYEGNLAKTVEADGFFDAIVPFSSLVGL